MKAKQNLILTPEEVTKRWKTVLKKDLSVRTLANWRSMGKGPKVTYFGHSPRYRLADVMKYEQQTKR